MALTAEWLAAWGRFHFERPAWLWALPLLLTLAGWLARRQAAAGHWDSLVDAPLRDALRLPEPALPRASPWPWLAGAWTLAVLALAGPTWQREPATAHATPEGWVLVLDLSPSMAATDVAPSRISRARYAIEDLLRAAQGAHIGLVVYSAEPYTVTPLTDDVATVRGLTNPLAPGLMPTAGDQLGPALSMAQQLLDRAATRGGHVVVLTDGCSDLTAASTAAQALRQRGTPVDVLAIGAAPPARVTPPPVVAPVLPHPLASGDSDPTDDVPPPTAPLDLAPLHSLAQAGGGRVYGLDAMPALIRQLHSQVTRMGSPLSGVDAVRWREAGVWLLLPLLLLAAGLARRGWW